MQRVLVLLFASAMLVVSAPAVSASPIGTQAAGSSGLSGSAWAWGSNAFGQLGNGSNTSSSTPVAVSLPTGTTVTAIAAGGHHNLALTSGGQVLAWGYNYYGQLGNGTTISSKTPVGVSPYAGATFTAIAAGLDHSLALTSGGQVQAWGSNAHGQLGNGGTTNWTTPYPVSLTAYTIMAIAGGGQHSLALTSSGQVLAWGYNFYGQLGNGTTTSSTTPVAVSLPSGTTVTAIAGGGDHSLALTSSGQVLAWGDNARGQLGNGTTMYSSTPVAVSLPSGTTVVAIAAGNNHSLALTSTGQVLAWGYNGDGELGNGTATNSSIPVAVSLPASTTITAIAGGYSHSLALTSSGQLLAWGYNVDGELGDGTTTSSSTPVAVSLPAGTTVTAIAAGGFHNLAIELPAEAVFPAMSNRAYGGYITAATIQNTGSAAATIRIAYYDQNGAPVGAGDAISSLPANASWTVRQDNGNSFPSSGGDAAQAGSAVVYSSQPVAAFVNEFAPGNVGDATSYSGVQVATGVGTTIYAPTTVNNAFGGYTTGIGLLNEGGSPTDVTITYRDGNGAVTKSQTVAALAAHAYRALYSGDTTLALPSGFAGTATITSSAGQPLAAVVNEVGPGGQFSSYDAVPPPSTMLGGTTLYAPVALRNAYGGYNTGMGIVNTTLIPGLVTVTYYDASGAATVKTFSIDGDGSLGVYQGTDIPVDGSYTAKITSTVAIAAIVNEVAASSTSAKQSTSYNTFSAGSATLHFPLVENAGSDGWSTGDGIMNTGTATTTVTVNYVDASTGAPVGTPQSISLAPNAFWGLYQPTGGLPPGTRATAVISTSSGGQVASICNESNATTFMSYDGQ